MPNRSSDSRCSAAARPCATAMGKSSKQQHSKREKMRRHLGEYNLIGGGSVRSSPVASDSLVTLCTSGAGIYSGNTRVISQTALDHFRTSLQTKQHDPYSVLLRRNKLPMQLLDDAANRNLRKVRISPPHLAFFAQAHHSAPILSRLSLFQRRLAPRLNASAHA
jgi:NGP1NT (NUC091) domain